MPVCCSVSTLEAVAALMGELEGDLGARDTMLQNLRIKVSYTLADTRCGSEKMFHAT